MAKYRTKQGNVFSNVLTEMTKANIIYYKYKPLKNGKSHGKMRICKERKIRYINLGVSIKARYWDFEKNQPNPPSPTGNCLKSSFFNRTSEVKGKIVELKAGNKEFSTTTLVDKVSDSTTVGKLSKQHKHCLEEGKKEQATGFPYNRPTIH